MSNEKRTGTGGTLTEQALTQEEETALQVKLWGLLAHRAALYTGGESSSVLAEEAQELMRSICFTLGIGEKTDPAALRKILEGNLDQAFRRGQRLIEGKLEIAWQRWRRVCCSLPALENQSLADTLGCIGKFWKQYDREFLAHAVPCDIDYQLCHSVPQDVEGIDYILEYLRRLHLENRFLRCFRPARCRMLLERYSPDWQGLLINLYEPVGTAAIGLALAGKPSAPLDIPAETCRDIARLIAPLDRAGLASLLRDAAARVCRALDICREGEQDYLEELAVNLCPRIQAALRSGNLGNIFLSFSGGSMV